MENKIFAGEEIFVRSSIHHHQYYFTSCPEQRQHQQRSHQFHVQQESKSNKNEQNILIDLDEMM